MMLKIIVFNLKDTEFKVTCPPEADIYSLCSLLDAGGAKDIKLYTTYETFDDLYLQGRSTRNLSSFPSTERQLELF